VLRTVASRASQIVSHKERKAVDENWCRGRSWPGHLAGLVLVAAAVSVRLGACKEIDCGQRWNRG